MLKCRLHLDMGKLKVGSKNNLRGDTYKMILCHYHIDQKIAV
jgi:hypothetical protein